MLFVFAETGGEEDRQAASAIHIHHIAHEASSLKWTILVVAFTWSYNCSLLRYNKPRPVADRFVAYIAVWSTLPSVVIALMKGQCWCRL